MNALPVKNQKPNSRDKLLNAAIKLIRLKGYTATTVDDLCEEAGVTKGSFFHYFENKEDLGVKAAKHWSEVTGELFKSASYHEMKDPFERVMAYIQFRKELLKGEVPEFTCLVGTLVQETHESHPEIRKACAQSIFGHAETLENDIAEVIQRENQFFPFSAKSLAVHTQAVIQGAFILVKASGDRKMAAESIDHLLMYFELLFSKNKKIRELNESRQKINLKRRVKNVQTRKHRSFASSL